MWVKAIYYLLFFPENYSFMFNFLGGLMVFSFGKSKLEVRLGSLSFGVSAWDWVGLCVELHYGSYSFSSPEFPRASCSLSRRTLSTRTRMGLFWRRQRFFYWLLWSCGRNWVKIHHPEQWNLTQHLPISRTTSKWPMNSQHCCFKSIHDTTSVIVSSHWYT